MSDCLVTEAQHWLKFLFLREYTDRCIPVSVKANGFNSLTKFSIVIAISGVLCRTGPMKNPTNKSYDKCK